MSCKDNSTLDTCGCCDNDIPQPDITNPPGQPMLAYRIGVHAAFLRRMVARLPRQRLPNGDHAGQRPLTALTSRASDDFGIALLDSWAVVGDVLTFYQERIANEGFLRTATERRSILELARAIGYELKPGVAAETYLAFTVDDSDPSLTSAAIPAGTQVQSIPKKQGELPQTFETGEEFTAHVVWNELRPRLTRPQSITAATTTLYLQGSSTNLSKGDRLLIVGSEKEANIESDHWDVRRVLAVTVESDRNRTRLTIEASSSGRPMPATPRIYAFRQGAAIFGHNAANWRTLSNQIRADYLGLDSPDEITDEEKLEWPDYTIFAPTGAFGEAVAPTRAVPVTARAVADAAIQAADRTAAALGESAAAAGPAAMMATVDAVSASAEAVVKTAQTFVALAGAEVDNIMAVFTPGASNPLTEILGSLASILNSFRPTTPALDPVAIDVGKFKTLNLFNLIFDPTGATDETRNQFEEVVGEIQDAINTLVSNLNKLEFVESANITTELNNIATQLELLQQNNPALAPFKVLQQLGADAPAEVQAVAQKAGQAVEGARHSVGAAISAGAAAGIAKLIAGAVEHVMSQPGVQPEDVESAARFTTRLARYASVGAAPQTLVHLPQTDAETPGELAQHLIDPDIPVSAKVDRLFLAWEEQSPELTVPADVQVPERDEDELALRIVFGLAAAGAGGASLAAAATAATAAASLSSVGLVAAPTLLSLIGPMVLPVVTASLVAGPELVSGAEQIMTAVDEAVAIALAPEPEDLPPRAPRPLISADKIDLDSTYDKIVPDSWLLLSLPGQEELCWITDVTEVSRADFNLMAKVSRLTLDSPDLSAFEFKVRQTSVFAQSEELALAEEDITTNVDGKTVLLNVDVGGLQPGQTFILIGQEAATGAETGELAVLHHTSLLDGLTRLHLENTLTHDYLRDSLFIFANVVHATHGESVKNEVLGGGDGAQPHQQFTLKKPPLTHISANTSSGAESELSLRVNGVEWQQEPSLYGLDGKSKSYVVRIDDDANAHIIFGDGKSGARLPTGQENVTATYRSGIGLDGEVGPNSLSLLKTRPFGVRGVKNPLAANGAEEPEKLADARENAPLTVLTLDRIVSLQDFEDFARAYAGIGKAQAVAIWSGEQELAHITIADSTGDPLDKQSKTYKNLLAAIEAARDPLRPVRVDNFKELSFSLAAKIRIDPAYLWETVQADIEAALLAEYAFDRRAFGQPVTAAGVIAVIHRIAGVEAVDLDKLRIDRAGEPLFSPVLGAQVATYQPATGQILPAQLLLINETGITLTEMSV